MNTGPTDMTSQIAYGTPVEVWTFGGWEPFDWDAYDTPEEAVDAFNICSTWRVTEDQQT